MQKLVNFRDRQELISADLSRIGEFAQLSFDHIVKDGIQDLRGFADLAVIKSGTAEVTAKPGRVYNAGAVYTSETDVVFDFIQKLPLVNKKWVAIVGWGNIVETDTQPRDFLIDATTGATEPDSVTMQILRKANINIVEGVEAAQPVQPAVDSANVIIAWVLLNPADVESVEMVEANRVPQVARERVRINELEFWRGLVGPRIDGLASDIARLAALLKQSAGSALLNSVAADVARLKDVSGLPDNYSSYGADRFLDNGESDIENVNYLARVHEGVRPAYDAHHLEAVQLFNPLNQDVKISSGLCLPAHTEVMKFKVQPFYEAHSISQYQYQTHEMVQKTRSLTRIQYGETTTVCTNSRWYKSLRYDKTVNGYVAPDGTTWVAEVQNGKYIRMRRYWITTYDEAYWDSIVVEHTISGQQIAQTFLNGQDGWLTSIGLYFTQKASTGNVTVMLCEVAHGAPNPEAVIAISTLNVADIKVSANGTVETKVAIPPTFVENGKRYGVVLTTGGNHYVAMANGTQYAQGSFFYTLDGAYMQGTAEKDMMFSLYYARFNKTRTVVELKSMSLSGGITDIDLQSQMAIPGSCSLTFQVQVAGVWHSLDNVAEGNTPLYSLPPLLPFRAVFVGTTDVQPALALDQSRLQYSRPRTSFKHISSNYILAASSDSFKVIVTLENYYETNHNLNCALLLNGVGGEIAPASVSDIEVDPPIDPRSPNHKNIQRTFTWTDTEITTPMSSVKIVLNGATSSALDTFHVSDRVHLAF